ncbi:MHS family MFS transporter [Pseudonocardia kujensis]|uniref:MFS transporter n=1 Tax=Pseudonocardia kujensis TaxID=1128675 RepID=UPI001E298DEE|nr:MFS transporter [Pseudonocardia kujensis]MCE0765547.1 MHS family MFS transporter [Pseudonocardia kujensis]
MAELTAPSTRTSPPRARRVALAGLVGTTIEWYDFFIYGTAAALVFAPQFFPGVSPLAGTLAALSTYAVGFVARPVGGALMGHFGDRIGRRAMLVLSLLIMGTGTALIGLLPTYASIGVAAPVLLVVLRFAQGLGVGGEWGGATLLALEHAPPGRRILYSSFPQLGLPLGVVLASVVFLVTRLGMSPEAFLSWSWRLPFLASAVLVVFGLLLRLRLEESPEFAATRKQGEVRRAPLVDVLRRPRILLPAAAVNLVSAGAANVMLVFSLGYVAARGLVSASVMLTATIVTALAWTVTIAVSAVAAQRLGRKPLAYLGSGLLALWAFPYFWLLDTGSVAATVLACVVIGLGVGLASGPFGALVTEAYPVAYRYSGSSLAYALGSVLGGALAPIVATVLFSATGGTTAISGFLTFLGLLSVAGVRTLQSPHSSHPDTEGQS